MTKEEFEELGNSEKTVYCYQYVEGDRKKSLSCAHGFMPDVLSNLASQLAMSFLYWKLGNKTLKANEAIDMFCNDIKEKTAIAEAAYLSGELKL